MNISTLESIIALHEKYIAFTKEYKVIIFYNCSENFKCFIADISTNYLYNENNVIVFQYKPIFMTELAFYTYILDMNPNEIINSYSYSYTDTNIAVELYHIIYNNVHTEINIYYNEVGSLTYFNVNNKRISISPNDQDIVINNIDIYKCVIDYIDNKNLENLLNTKLSIF
jgi:hypothetical protein